MGGCEGSILWVIILGEKWGDSQSVEERMFLVKLAEAEVAAECALHDRLTLACKGQRIPVYIVG